MRSGTRALGSFIASSASLARLAGLAGPIGLAALALSVGGSGCGSSKTGAEHFAGTWTYAGMIDANCSGLTVAPLDLTGDTTVITATDSSHLSVALGSLCTVKFDVDGFTANAPSGQSCMFDLGGNIGQQSVTITKWTLTSTNTDTITSDFAGAAFVCTPAGTGTLTRVGDAGATD